MTSNAALAVKCPQCSAPVNAKCTSIKLVEQADGSLARQATPTAPHVLRKQAAAKAVA